MSTYERLADGWMEHRWRIRRIAGYTVSVLALAAFLIAISLTVR